MYCFVVILNFEDVFQCCFHVVFYGKAVEIENTVVTYELRKRISDNFLSFTV